MALERFRGLGEALGSFGRSIIERVQRIGGTIRDLWETVTGAGIEVEAPALKREWGEVATAVGRQSDFAALGPQETPDPSWYEESQVPWMTPIAYKVAVYGRRLITEGKYRAGQFAREEYDITVSRPLTVADVLDEAGLRVGKLGGTPRMEIFSIKLIGASVRAGEEWRW